MIYSLLFSIIFFQRSDSIQMLLSCGIFIIEERNQVLSDDFFWTIFSCQTVLQRNKW